MGIRMTLQTRLVLQVFVDAPTDEHYGLEICRAIGVPGGTIYPLLTRLELAGWLKSGWEAIDPVAAGRRPRRYYRLTPDGAESARKVLAANPTSLRLAGRPEPGTATS
jgi:PadR family transcriptional regulator PadR